MKKSCTWILKDEDIRHYETSCDNAFLFFEGFIKDNHFKFCPFCGGVINER